MRDIRLDKALKSYEATSVLLMLSLVLCGIARLMMPELLLWSIFLFLAFAALSTALGAYLLIRQAHQDPRFKLATLIDWTAVSVFALVLLWVQYGG